MRIIVGGESRKSGKTTVVCRILGAFPDAGWTVVKISPHMHTGSESGWSFEEDSNAGDTLRYRKAGARRTFLYCGPTGPGLQALLDVLSAERNWIVETTAAGQLIPHDLAILVAAPAGVEPKNIPSGFPPHVRLDASDPTLESLVLSRWKS